MSRRWTWIRFVVTALVCASPGLGQKYNGPVPPKPDVPYLVHGDNLVETEIAEAKENDQKDDMIYVVPGANSPARTPLAEPIFLIRTEKLAAEKLELYRLESKGGSRRIVFPKKKKRDAPRPMRTFVTKLSDGLYRIEANETLENGEYSLTPAGSNQVFCFQVY